MDYLIAIDWEALFRPRMSLAEVVIRGTLVYVALCVLLRVVLKRQAGKVAMTDLLVVTLVAGVCRNPLVRDAYSITDGLSVVAVILAWGYALDWLCYRVPWIHRLLHPEPVVLIEGGEVQHDNLRRELVTESQLRSQLRQQGVSSPAEVSEALLEGSGKISVLRDEERHRPAPAERNGTHPPAAADGRPHPAGEDADVAEFLHAADRLREKIARHECRIAVHRAAVAELKGVLAEHGVRWKHHEPTETHQGGPE